MVKYKGELTDKEVDEALARIYLKTQYKNGKLTFVPSTGATSTAGKLLRLNQLYIKKKGYPNIKRVGDL